jgi:hypothetical protein
MISVPSPPFALRARVGFRTRDNLVHSKHNYSFLAVFQLSECGLLTNETLAC